MVRTMKYNVGDVLIQSVPHIETDKITGEYLRGYMCHNYGVVLKVENITYTVKWDKLSVRSGVLAINIRKHNIKIIDAGTSIRLATVAEIALFKGVN